MNNDYQDLTQEIEQLSCASLVDAMGRVHDHRAHLLPLVSPSPRPLFGPAATLAYLPRRADLDEKTEDFGALFYRSLGESPKGKVLVLSSGGHPDVSHGGGTKLSRLEHVEAAGVLADGRLRDFDELAAFGFATWCRGEATRAGGETVSPVLANSPVEFGGVRIVPGDYVYADSSGGVVIPHASLRQVLDEAAKVEAEDKGFAREIANESPAAPRSAGDEGEGEP
ncbi:MAG TPA: RraA family protein [Solirubrobacterales bacterium]|nr:RraA family protein [Solirubrobacterales bacterium]